MTNSTFSKLLFLAALSVTALFVVSASMPLFTLSKFYVFDNQVSLFSGIGQLWQEQEYFLFTLLGAFCVLLPMLKLGILMLYSVRFTHPKLVVLLRQLHGLSRWSMLDVFVVALLAVTVKLGAIAHVEIHLGYYLFCCSVLIIMLLIQLVLRRIDTQG